MTTIEFITRCPCKYCLGDGPKLHWTCPKCDGYKTFKGEDVFNPRSVVYALSDGVCQSYWTNTGPMDEIIYYINNDVGSVKDLMMNY